MQDETILEAQAQEAWLRSRRNAFTLKELARGDVRPPEPLFEGLLLHNTITMISGEPFTGKTLFLLATALSLSSGKPLLGRFAPSGLRRVLFVGQDAPTWDYAGQAMKLARGYGLTPEELQHAEVDLVLNEGILITDAVFLEWLGQWWEATHFEVLMLDTLLDLHGMDENSNSQMRPVMKQLKKIRDDLGVAIMFSHHTSKGLPGDDRSANYRARGATVIPGSSDFHFQLRQGKEQVDFLWPKGRGVSSLDPPTSFRIIETTVSEGPAISLAAATIEERERGIIDILGSGPLTRSAIIAAVLSEEPGLEPNKAAKWVDNHLQILKRAKSVEQEKRGLWKLTP